MKLLQVTSQQAARLTFIEQDPSPNSLWQQLRRARLTASKFGTVVKRHKNFNVLVESILHKPPPDSVAALEWGRSHESNCTSPPKHIGESYQVTRSGIHISIEHPWLVASPDGHVVDPSESVERQYGILEIKCPYSARRVTPEIARFCCTLVDGRTSLKKAHSYYHWFKAS